MSDEQYEGLRRQYAELLNYLSSIARESGAFHQTIGNKLDTLTNEFREHKQETKEQLASLEERVTNIVYQLKILNREHLQVKANVERLEDKVYKLENEAA